MSMTTAIDRAELQRVANLLPKSGAGWKFDFGNMVRRVLWDLDAAEEEARHHNERAKVK
ncbi:hypothetical protein LCGC14_0289530 [marine sediment metagenome]|uniref:Uncharacterized protein n=1 Tax=marine sediment metagenome TaxID=412755 RepID=A0A0F9WF31_9ZZZZ